MANTIIVDGIEYMRVSDLYSRWKPKMDDTYCLIEANYKVYHVIWTNSELDNLNYKFGNVYKEEEQAKIELDKRLLIVEIKDLAFELNMKAVESDPGTLSYDRKKNEWTDYYLSQDYKVPGLIIFNNRELIKICIEKFKERLYLLFK